MQSGMSELESQVGFALCSDYLEIFVTFYRFRVFVMLVS